MPERYCPWVDRHEVWSGAEAADRLRDPVAVGDLREVPLLTLDLRESAGEPVPVDGVPCPVVALVPPGATCSWQVDLVLADGSPDTALLADTAEAAAAVLAGAAAASPRAAGLLAQVLRATADLPVPAALAVESAAYSLLLTGADFTRWLATRRVPRPATDDGNGVVVRRDGAVLELVLDRPAVRNAYNTAIRDGLFDGLSLAVLDPSVERVVVRGNGPSFCSGGDLREFGTSEDLVAAHGRRTTRHPGPLLHRLGARATVHVHGACVGAGVELPAFAGRVVAAAGTTFRLPEVAMGTIPGAGGTVSLPRRIGRPRTLLLALSGIVLPVEHALRWGLVDACERDVSA
jgi:enoyl-CoA hydratase/carnithine racemase